MGNTRRWLPGVWCAVIALAVPLPTTPGQEDDTEQGIRLSLDETLRIALASNLDLVSARLDPRVSELNLQAQKANYDVNLTAGLNKTVSDSSEDDGGGFSSIESENYSVGITQRLSFGANYSLTLDGSRFEAAGLNLDLTPEELAFLLGGFDPISYGAGLALELSVPLARLGRETELESLILARSDLAVSRERLRTRAHGVILDVEGAYWEVLTNREELKIARLSLQRAEELLERSRKKVEAGTLAPIEITEGEAGVASQVERVIVSETALENAEDRLLLLLDTPAESPMWDLPIIPTDRPSFTPVEIDLAETIALALERRPEMINARRELTDSDLSARVARRRTRPSVDLTATIRSAGDDFEPDEFDLDAGSDGVLGTDDDVEIFRSLELGDAIREIPEFVNYDWTLSLNVAYPILNRAAKAAYAISRISRDRAQIDVRSQEQSIRVEVRRAVRSVESSVKRVEASRKSLELQRKKLDAEKRKFESGTSTSFEVLAFQDDLADAEVSEIRAALDYLQALTELERAKGTLLEARGLTLAD